MLHVGIAGIGFMGMIHYLAYQGIGGVKVRAICDQDPDRLAGDWRKIKGNFGPEGAMMDLEGVTGYFDLAEMIADPKLDLIDICLPPAMHCPVALHALRAGKHVFCEKPIALVPSDADQMIRAAGRAGKMLMVGHVLPFFPEYRFAWQTIATGKYGRFLGAHLKRIISDPTWLPDFYDPKKTGGPMIDLHIHDAHFIRLIGGMPRSVQTVGRMRGKVAELFDSQFLFADPSLLVTASGGTIQPRGRPFTQAYEIYLERATMFFDYAALANGTTASIPLTVLNYTGRINRPRLGSGDPVEAFVSELTEVVRSIRRQAPAPALDPVLARDALVLCHRQTESLARRRAVRV